MRLRSFVVGAMVLAFAAVGLVAEAAPARRPQSTRRKPQPVVKSSDEKPLSFGVQASYGIDDADLGVGARVIYSLSNVQKGLKAVGSFDYFFPGEEVTYFEINANATYDIPLEGSSLTPYLGAGLNIAHASVDTEIEYGDASGSNTDLGLNLLGGANFGSGSMKFFVEGRIELGGGEQFVLTGGIRF